MLRSSISPRLAVPSRPLLFALALGAIGVVACVDPGSLTAFECTPDGHCPGDAGAGGGTGGGSGGGTGGAATGGGTGGGCTGSGCVDVDECALDAGLCGPTGVCTNTASAWDCSCAAGWAGPTVTGGPVTCADVNECGDAGVCGANAGCTNLPGTFECRCQTGFFGAVTQGAPTSCSATDPCATAGRCGANATCSLAGNSYACDCNAGYSGASTTGAPATCVDADECATVGVCGANAVCTNTPGSFTCSCAPGFSGPATLGSAASCTDVNECGDAGVCGANATCTNQPAGSFTCSCTGGYYGNTVQGGPTSCSTTDVCGGTACGANAHCVANVPSYTCACNAGYAGTAVENGPTTCADVDECGDAGVCGATGVCTNLPGSFLCGCPAGMVGVTVDGGPSSCAPGLVPLGAAQATTATLTLTLDAGVDAGTTLVLVAAGFSLGGVTDTRLNTWSTIVSNSNCAPCGEAAVYTVRTTAALKAGDVVSLGARNGDLASAWLFTAPAYPWLDKVGTISTNNSTTTPTAVTNNPVSDSQELLVGAFATENNVVLKPDGGFVSQGAFASNGVSGLLGSREASGLSGVQAFQATASSAQRFSGVIATFAGGPQVAPSSLSLTQAANSRTFTVSWASGHGNGGAIGCLVQVQLAAGTWSTLSTVDCDTTASGLAVALPSTTNWYGASWSSVPVRLVRKADGAVLGTFPQRLTCTVKASSVGTSTPNVDENCNGTWNEHTCTTWTWVAGYVYDPTAWSGWNACTDSAGAAATSACTSTAEGVSRYTAGTQTTKSPAVVWSSDAFSPGCPGSNTGATTWSCTGSGCTYN